MRLSVKTGRFWPENGQKSETCVANSSGAITRLLDQYVTLGGYALTDWAWNMLTRTVLVGLFTTSLTILGSSPAPAFADTYRWVDANGIVNYSERKPRGIPDSQVTVVSDRSSRPSSTPNANALPQTTSSRAPAARASGLPSEGQPGLNDEQQAMLDRLQAAEVERQAQVEQIRNDNCNRARQVLANLSSRGRIRVVGADGEERVLPEDERTSRIEEAQRGVASNCDA